MANVEEADLRKLYKEEAFYAFLHAHRATRTRKTKELVIIVIATDGDITASFC